MTGNREIGLINFAFAVLPTIISSSLMVLYHIAMQWIVKGMAWVMLRRRPVVLSPSAAANIFVGQTEAPLVIKPFVEKMTRSELMTVMTGGFATVAGGSWPSMVCSSLCFLHRGTPRERDVSLLLSIIGKIMVRDCRAGYGQSDRCRSQIQKQLKPPLVAPERS